MPPLASPASLLKRPSRRRTAPAHPSPVFCAAQATLLYALIAGLWIDWSDRLLFAFVSDAGTLARVATWKGWIFVVVTAVGLFWVVWSRWTQRRDDAEKLKSFVEHAPVAIAMLDRNLRYVMTSRRWRTDFATGDRDLTGVRHYDVFPDLPGPWCTNHLRALDGEGYHGDADAWKRADGTMAWFRRDVQPWRDSTGAIGGIVIFIEDVSVRKQTDDALAEGQSRLRLALEAGRVSTWTWNVADDRIDYDEGIQRLIGRSRAEIAQGGLEFFRTIVHPEDRAGLDRTIASTLANGAETSADYRVVHPDGRIAWIADRGTIERDASGTAVRMVGACVDVTESRRMQEELHESERRFRELVETIREVFWVSDVTKDRIIYVSPGYAQIWGRPGEELYASSRAWLAAVHTDDRERILHAALTKQAAGTYDETYRIVRPDGSIRWVRDRAYPVRDATGTLVRIVGCASDITERKLLEEQFLRAQRLEAIGTLAGGIAHDLNNILAPMFMIGPLLKAKLADPSDISMLSIVETSARRGANVVRQLLTFSRGIAGERGPLQVRHLVKEMTAIMHETFPREIGIVHQIPADLWPVVGDATQLHQVLMNLCVNARDAMVDGGVLSIDAHNAEIGAEALAGYGWVKPGRFVVITVSDTGHGIPDDVKAKIFEPFFTTKAVGKGTGLGLSTVLGIVKSHGGFVSLESHVGRFTKFHVHVPSSDAKEDLTTPVPVAEAAPGHGELILIVDDEVNVRQAMQRVLEHNGYGVMAAANGREALGLYLLQRDKVRVVVTDLMMPEMNGVALVRALRDLGPDLPILASTGLIDGENRDSLEAMRITELLPKPYTSFELVEAIARALEPKQGAAVPAADAA